MKILRWAYSIQYPKKAKQLIRNNDVKNELVEINSFNFLPDKIKELESASLTVTQQLGIIENVKQNLFGEYLNKLNNSL